MMLWPRSPVEAVATALVFLHKFFMLHSFQKHERFFVGSACLFLAAKVEVRALCAFFFCVDARPASMGHRWRSSARSQPVAKNFFFSVADETIRFKTHAYF